MPEVQEVANVLLGSRDKVLGRLRAAAIAQLNVVATFSTGYFLSQKAQEQEAASLLFPSGMNLGKEKKAMRLTRRNGRAGKNGVYNPKHNDRSFDVANSEHIDAERVKNDIYWDCYNGFRTQDVGSQDEELSDTFEDVEQLYYRIHYQDYINPMDINMDYSDDDNPLGVKSDFVLSLCELIMGSRDGIEAEEKSVIDRCLPLVYQKYFADPRPENMPVLGDLYDCLRKQKEPQAQRIATALEIYVNGSLKVFNHQTNVEMDNRIICFDIKDLGKQLKKLGMLIVQDQVWNRVTINRNTHKSTRYYIDEFHLLLKEEQTAAYSVEIWKRFRKWGGIPTGITQNIKDLLASREIENIFENSDFILMLNQAAGDRQILAKQLNISPYQLSYVTNSGEGEGLLFYGSTIIPFKDKFDKTLKLYSLMTTKPEEVEARKQKEMEE